VVNKPQKVKLSDSLISYAKSGKTDNSKLKEVENALINKGDILYDTELKGFHVKRSGVNTVSFRHYYRINGQRKNITLGTFPEITTAAARTLAKEKALEVANGKSPVDEKREALVTHKLTLQEYLDHDYSIFMERAIRKDAYLAKIRGHFPELLNRPLDSIIKTDLVKWLQAQMVRYTKHEHGYSSDSVIGRYSALKSLFAHAVRNAVIDKSPFDKMERLEFHRDESTKKQIKRWYLTLDQQKAFITSVDAYDEKLRAYNQKVRDNGNVHIPDLENLAIAYHHKPMLLILYYMGMRSGDVVGLEWSHIIDTPFTCSITKVLEKTRRKIKTPYVLPMPIQVRDILRIWRKQQGNPNKGLVFPAKNGGRLSNSCLKSCWAWIVEDAGLPSQYVPYTLRHNYISWLIMNGEHLKVVANLAGHKTTNMIELHYGHLASGHNNQAAQSFADLLNSDEQESLNNKVS